VSRVPRSLSIAFFGSSLVSSYWNGAATYYRGLIRALHERGHRVTFYEPDAYDRQAHRDLDDPPWARDVVYAAEASAARAMLERARGADVIVKTSGIGVLDEFLEEAVLGLKGDGTRVGFWDVDAPATLERVTRNHGDPFRELIPRYDFVFTYGGGDPVVRAYEALGASICVPVYNALDPTTHFRTDADPRYACDLALLANRLPDREARIEEFFFRAALAAPEARFLLGGSGWEGKDLPPNVRAVGHVPTTEHNAFNASAAAVLNVSRESMARFGFSPATRVFEAAGAGACIVTDAWEGIELFLAPGSEILVARDGAEVAAALRSLTSGTARAIGEAARRRVLAEHTYARRAELVEERLLSLLTPAAEPSR
jgi:spore maturation protein CgeB